MKQDGILADASTLIYLAKADSFHEAHVVVGVMLIPPAVWQEAVDDGARRGERDPAVIMAAIERGYARRVTIAPTSEQAAHDLGERYRLGRGESQLLAIRARGNRVLIDDSRAARAAAALGLVPVSTVSIPILGYHERTLGGPVALDLLHRLARVVSLRADTLARLEVRLEDRT